MVSPTPPVDAPEAVPGWSWYSSIEVRQDDHPAVPTPIPGMLEGRLTLLAGAGGSGKTTLTEQIIRHLCSERQLGRFDLPERTMVGWCIYLEDIPSMAQDRSLRAAPLGSLAEDARRERSDTSVRYLFGSDFRIYDLERELETAAEQQVLPGIVIIDHLRILIGSQPAGTSPNDWERKCLFRLMALANRFDLHIIVLTHLNKQGAVSGTTELINSVDTAYVIEVSTEDRMYATLKCHKMRMSPETDFALMKRANGTWMLTDEVWVSENQALGIARDIIKVLRAEGPTTLSDLCMHHKISGNRAGIRAALDRSRRRGWVRPYRGHWEAIPGAGDDLLRPETPEPTVPAPRGAPDAPPGAPPRASAAPAPDPEEDTWEPDAEPEGHVGFRGLDVMKESIKRSRMHPIPVIPKEKRDQPPWTLITERMNGAPSWVSPQTPMGGVLLRLDRNGSFPSACSSVPVAPNALIHTGPQDLYDSSRAGIYCIECPAWDISKFPHPLGKIAKGKEPGDPVWISTPHMRLLDQLASSHRIPRVAIMDSWTGRGNGSLFEHFYKEARAKRIELVEGDEDEYVAYKRSVSIALRYLWPKKKAGPIWRPDWRVSVVAEASVRHWAVADRAVAAGATLVSMSNTDEVLFWTPDGEVPAPYEVGTKFGQIKVKPQVD